MGLIGQYHITAVSGGEAHEALRIQRAVIAPRLTPEDIDLQRNQPRREPTPSATTGHYVSKEHGIPLGHSVGAVQFALGVHRTLRKGAKSPTVPPDPIDASKRPLATKATIPTVVWEPKFAGEPSAATMPTPWYARGRTR